MKPISASTKFYVFVLVVAFCILVWSAIGLMFLHSLAVGFSVLAASCALSMYVIGMIIYDIISETKSDWKNSFDIADDCFVNVRELAVRVNAEVKK